MHTYTQIFLFFIVYFDTWCICFKYILYMESIRFLFFSSFFSFFLFSEFLILIRFQIKSMHLVVHIHTNIYVFLTNKQQRIMRFTDTLYTSIDETHMKQKYYRWNKFSAH